MAVYTKEYESQPEAILTNVIICPAVDLSANVAVPVHCQVENVLWDTGATNTLISQEVVNALGLQRLSLKPWGIALKFLFLHHENILFPND